MLLYFSGILAYYMNSQSWIESLFFKHLKKRGPEAFSSEEGFLVSGETTESYPFFTLFVRELIVLQKVILLFPKEYTEMIFLSLGICFLMVLFLVSASSHSSENDFCSFLDDSSPPSYFEDALFSRNYQKAHDFMDHASDLALSH